MRILICVKTHEDLFFCGLFDSKILRDGCPVKQRRFRCFAVVFKCPSRKATQNKHLQNTEGIVFVTLCLRQSCTAMSRSACTVGPASSNTFFSVLDATE